MTAERNLTPIMDKKEIECPNVQNQIFSMQKIPENFLIDTKANLTERMKTPSQKSTLKLIPHFLGNLKKVVDQPQTPMISSAKVLKSEIICHNQLFQ